jgi:uncharacterized protein (TIGR02996 family)
MLTSLQALWQAILRTPEDVALHMAFADCLIEEGYPEGEKLRICLGVADGSIPKSYRHDKKAIYDFIQLFEVISPVKFGWIAGLPRICELNWSQYIKYSQMIVQKIPITEWIIEGMPLRLNRQPFGDGYAYVLSVITERRLLAFNSEHFAFDKHQEGIEFISKGLYYFARSLTYEDSCSDDYKRFVRGLTSAFP